MKKRLLMLLAAFMAVTSVGWVHAQDGPTITTDLTVAQKGRAIVFGITTKKGNAEDMNVRASLTAADNAFDTWDSYYYEPNEENPGWVKWDPKNDGFGPAEGFPLMDATSYIKVVPKETGTFSYTLKVTKVGTNSNETIDVITNTCTLVVKDEPVSPVASIGDTDYASLPTAVLFAEKDNTISLTAGDFVLSSQLVIDKPITLLGAAQNDGKPLTNLKADANANWPKKQDGKTIENKTANLVSIEGAAEGNVFLRNIRVMSSQASGINAQSKMTTNLHNVALEANANAGLLVHSAVIGEGLVTINNGWGSVNVGTDGTPVYSPKFTFDPDCSFAEQSKIWSEDTTSDPSTLVEGPNGWTSYVGVQGSSSKEMRYWTNSKLTQEKGLYTNTTFVYANGNPVVIEKSDEGKVKISVEGTNDFIELAESANPVVLGGSKEGTVASTKITMKSGTVYRLYGGGYGTSADKQAKVTGTSTIIMEGGVVWNSLFGGGLRYAHSKDVVIKISQEQTDIPTAVGKPNTDNLYWLICGGDENGKTTGDGYLDFDKSNNTVEFANLTIDGGTFRYIALGGTDGAKGYIKNVTADIKNAKITGGVYGNGSNGRSDKVIGTLTNCTFEKITSVVEIAAVNRGKSKDVSLTFDNCTFPTEASDIYVYLGATYHTLLNYKGSEYGIPENVNFTFKGEKAMPVVGVSDGLAEANVTLTGAKGHIAKFEISDSQSINAFTIPTGKTWTFNGGLEFAAEEANKATLINNGTLVVPATDIMAGIAAGGTLAVDTTSTAVVAEMNKATNKSDLSSKTFSIECKDGVIASNETVAKELLKAGKVVMVLSLDGEYKIASYQKTLAKITNLPDSVVYGTAPITLAFNLPGTEVSINGNTSEVVELKDGVLTIKKPGTVTFELKVKKNTNDSEYDPDAANTQILKVNKRKVTLTKGLEATTKVYDGNTNITLTKGETLTFSGKLGTDATGLDLAANPTGKLTDANAGENKEVIVTAVLAAANGSDSTAYYELAPITFVKAKVTPKAATVTATAASRDYGVENPEFTATTTDLVTGDKLDGILKFTCTATKESLANTYDIVPYGLTSDNYTITFTKGTLTVNAVNPVIEMVEAKTVLKSDNSAKEIQLKAKLIHAGGAKEITSVKFVQGSTDVTATLDNGYYTGKFDVSAGTTYSVKASATADSKTGESKAISIVVDALTPQVVSFGASVLPTMVYGNEMTLSAMSDQTAATGDYTYSVAEGDPATIADGKLKATKVGKVTLTVSRAADVAHSAAVATQTIEIMPKPITVTVGAIEKVYDGTAAIEKLPTFTLTGASDDVSVKTSGLTLSFASKNAGESVKVLMPELTLTGDNAANYTLIQPKNVTGKITKAPLTVKVKDVTRMWNQRYTKYEFEATGLVNDETLSNVYSGVFNVTEEGSVLNLNMPGACPNYAITTVPGTLTINKGTPVAVVYGPINGEIKAMVVDEAGYTGLKVSEVKDGYANILDANGKVIGQSLNKISTPATATTSFKAPMQMKAAVADNWNLETFEGIPYGTPYEVTKLDGFGTYESTNTNVLTISTKDGNVVCTPVATGKATVLAINSSSGEVKILNLEVSPAELTVKATDMDKTYDGTSLATGTLELTGAEGKDVALDLSGITFNFADKAAGEGKIITPSQSLILIGSEANNYVLEGTLTGKINQKEVTVETPLSAYYNGKNVMELTDYTSNDRISGDIVPIRVTFGAATAGEQAIKELEMGTTGDAANYKLADSKPTNGNILKSTVVAELPANASSVSNLKSNIKLTIRETGETVASSVIAFNPTITSEGSGSNTVYYVNGGETVNYSVVYDKNQLGYKAAPTPPSGGGDEGDETVTISLDATTKTLPRNEEFVLKATVSPSDKTVTWSSSDPTIASVTANGNSATVKALKVGTATITAKIGDVTATCEVTVDFATGLEEALANTQVYAKQGSIYVNPIQPLQLTIVNMLGKTVYNARISSYAQIPVTNGIYIVKLTNAGNTIVTKVNVY